LLKENNMLNAKHIAEYFLTYVDEDAGEGITNLKLQKLVYYAQGVYLAIYKKPLFNASIEAWIHGPIVASLYHIYEKYGNNPIPTPKQIDFSIYSQNVKEILDEVYNVFGQFSAWKLQHMVYEELPWKETIYGNVISLEVLHKYFKTIIKKDLID